MSKSNLRNVSRRFLFNGDVTQKEILYYKKEIKKLGGQYMNCRNEQFIVYCSHVVCFNFTATIKSMCGLAAGKWIVSPEFLKESIQAGHWLKEEDFEIKEENEIAKFHRKRTGPLFSGMNIYLVLRDENLKRCYRRVLLAGGANALNIENIRKNKTRVDVAICDNHSLDSVLVNVPSATQVVKLEYLISAIFNKHNPKEYDKYLWSQSNSSYKLTSITHSPVFETKNLLVKYSPIRRRNRVKTPQHKPVSTISEHTESHVHKNAKKKLPLPKTSKNTRDIPESNLDLKEVEGDSSKTESIEISKSKLDLKEVKVDANKTEFSDKSKLDLNKVQVDSSKSKISEISKLNLKQVKVDSSKSECSEISKLSLKEVTVDLSKSKSEIDDYLKSTNQISQSSLDSAPENADLVDTESSESSISNEGKQSYATFETIVNNDLVKSILTLYFEDLQNCHLNRIQENCRFSFSHLEEVSENKNVSYNFLEDDDEEEEEELYNVNVTIEGLTLMQFEWRKRTDRVPEAHTLGKMVQNIIKSPNKMVSNKSFCMVTSLADCYPPANEVLRSYWLNVFRFSFEEYVNPNSPFKGWTFLERIVEDCLSGNYQYDAYSMLECVIKLLELDLAFSKQNEVPLNTLLSFRMFWIPVSENPSLVNSCVREVISFWLKASKCKKRVRRLLSKLLGILLDVIWTWDGMTDPFVLSEWPMTSSFASLGGEISRQCRVLEGCTKEELWDLVCEVEVAWHLLFLSSIVYRVTFPEEQFSVFSIPYFQSKFEEEVHRCSSSKDEELHSKRLNFLTVLFVSFVEGTGIKFCRQKIISNALQNENLQKLRSNYSPTYQKTNKVNTHTENGLNNDENFVPTQNGVRHSIDSSQTDVSETDSSSFDSAWMKVLKEFMFVNGFKRSFYNIAHHCRHIKLRKLPKYF